MAMPKIFTHVFSDGTQFHWTFWGSRRIPLFRISGVYRPVASIRENLIFCHRLLRLLSLKPREFVDAPAIEGQRPKRQHIEGYESRISYLSWMTIVMSPDKIDLGSHRNAVFRTIAALKAGHR